MSRPVLDRLSDIIQSAELAAEHIDGLDENTLNDATANRDAAFFRVAVVCEAATKLPAEIKAFAPEIDWRQIRGMRNILVHDYWQIDIATVVDTISNDLEPLKATIRRLIAIVERSTP